MVRISRIFPLVVLLELATAAEQPATGEFTYAELVQRLQEVTREFEIYKAQTSQELASIKAVVHTQGEEQMEPGVHAPAGGLPRGLLRHDRQLRRLHSSDTAAIASLEVRLTAKITDVQGAMSHIWLLLCGALVMFMQAGFMLLEAGCCRYKNVQNIMMKNLTDVCIGTLCWWAFGWMFAYGPIEGETKFAGNTEYFGHDFMYEDPRTGVITGSSKPLGWFFRWTFCSAAATIVSGGIAERVNFPGYLLYTLWMTSIVYPVVVAWTWSGKGWLQGGIKEHINEVGYYDFAGSGIVHMCGGVGALVGAIVVGPRTGRFEDELVDNFEPHSLPFIVLGTFILWFGWYGFNCGSTLGMTDTATGQLAASVAMNTTIAAATGGLTVLALRLAILKKYDVAGMCNGILAGLVSITAPCANVECGSAFVIGLLGGLIYVGVSALLLKLKIDDPIDAFAVHGACGAWGTLAAVIFDWGDGIGRFHGWGGFSCTAKNGGCRDDARGLAFLANLVGVIVIAAWTALMSLVVFLPLRLARLLRAPDDVQTLGMDSKHSPRKAYQSDVTITKVVPTS